MADERARAREAALMRSDVPLDHIDGVLGAIDKADLSIIDTRTHVAVPIADDEAMVEAVARALIDAVRIRNGARALTDDEFAVWQAPSSDGVRGVREHYGLLARAALAAVRAHAAKEG